VIGRCIPANHCDGGGELEWISFRLNKALRHLNQSLVSSRKGAYEEIKAVILKSAAS
jgi:hypothetical protein